MNDKRKSLMIVMTVFNREEEILNQRTYNFLNPRHRERISKTAWWAMHNGHEMITRPVDEDEEIEIVGHPREERS